MFEGAPMTVAQLVIYKPGKADVENREVTFDTSGKATAIFNDATGSERRSGE
jgi:hypothetical protein